MSSPSDRISDMAGYARMLVDAGATRDQIAEGILAQYGLVVSEEMDAAIEHAQVGALSDLGLGDMTGLGVPLTPAGPISQWEGEVGIIMPDGEIRTEYIRVPREPGDTDQDVMDKLLLARIELEAIIAERGGEYEVIATIQDFWGV